MCNAWNHPVGCTCGWGGDGHLGGGGNNNNSYNIFSKMSVHTNRTLLDTYLNPNAKCPVCGAPVYFYQSPFGGRVFFDEVGPPWPKHPCTSQGNEELIFISGVRTKPKWQANEWCPAVLANIGRKSKHLIAFLILDGRDNFIAEAYMYSVEEAFFINKADFIFYRELDNFYFDIRCYNVLSDDNRIFRLKKRTIHK